jgi:hypothetical protein
VPVDVHTTGSLIQEIKRLRGGDLYAETDARLDWIERLGRSPTREESAAFMDGFRAAKAAA